MLDILALAIKEKREIEFIYNGFERAGKPVAIGRTKSGKDVIRLCQPHGGYLHPKNTWNLYTVDEISELELTENTYKEIPAGYQRGDKGMHEIYLEL